MEQTMSQEVRPTFQISLQNIIYDLRMASSTTTERYPVKPKTLTLLELCQTISDYRRPPPSLSSYHYQSSPNAAHILTRRLYLHPLTSNSFSKQHQQTRSAAAALEIEHRQQFHSDKKRMSRNSTHKSHQGLAILSSSFPLITRLNTKIDSRPLREGISLLTDDDNLLDHDESSISLQQSFLPSISRGTSSSMRTMCSRASRTGNKPNVNRWEKVDVWQQLDRVLLRPIPTDPPTTPLGIVSEFYAEQDGPRQQSPNGFIREITIHRRGHRIHVENNNNNIIEKKNDDNPIE